MNSSYVRAQDGARALSETRPTATQLWSSVAIGVLTGLLASLCSVLGVPGWYTTLVKPLWAPPSWAFTPVQLMVFALMGTAFAFLQASSAPLPRKRVVQYWFWIQLVLNLAWSAAFFAVHSASWGYAIGIVLWCAVVALIWTGSRLSRTAFYFLVPLFLWVTFTSSLNFAILSFNVLRQETAEMDADPRNANSPIDPSIIVKKK